MFACNGSVASDDAGIDGSTFDATSDGASDAVADAASDVVAVDASEGGMPQCAAAIPKVDDAGLCHGGDAATLDCFSQDPSFDRCVVAQLHELDGATFEAMQCFDSDAETGQAACCNGVNPSGVILLVDPSWTCCPGPAPDGGTAACDPDAGEHCTAVSGGWSCQ